MDLDAEPTRTGRALYQQSSPLTNLMQAPKNFYRDPVLYWLLVRTGFEEIPRGW